MRQAAAIVWCWGGIKLEKGGELQGTKQQQHAVEDRRKAALGGTFGGEYTFEAAEGFEQEVQPGVAEVKVISGVLHQDLLWVGGMLLQYLFKVGLLLQCLL
jgi:hypothetical protein